MLHDHKLSMFLWVEVANTIVYVHNRTPHQALGDKSHEEVFIGVKLDVGHLRIFGCLVYFHVSKDKRDKLEASGKKDVALGKARDTPPPAPVEKKDNDMDTQEGPFVPRFEPDVDDDPMEPMNPLDPPTSDPSSRKRPLWFHDTLQDVERHVISRGTFRESKNPCRYEWYVVAMRNMIQAEPHTFEEAMKEQVWKDGMAEEYESIMNNDVWEVVMKPKGKFVMNSKWLYKIKHGVDGSIKKYKARFMARGFYPKRGRIL
eukprot:PITA_19079